MVCKLRRNLPLLSLTMKQMAFGSFSSSSKFKGIEKKNYGPSNDGTTATSAMYDVRERPFVRIEARITNEGSNRHMLIT